jgi:hypothetical protein
MLSLSIFIINLYDKFHKLVSKRRFEVEPLNKQKYRDMEVPAIIIYGRVKTTKINIIDQNP